MNETIFYTLAEFCSRLNLSERRTAKVLALVPSRQRGGRTEYDFRLGSAMIFADLRGFDPATVCPTCLRPGSDHTSIPTHADD